MYLAAALVIAAVVFIVEKPEKPRIGDVAEKDFIANFDSSKIFGVKISQLIDGVVLKREGDVWQVSQLITPARKELNEKEGGETELAAFQNADKTRVMGAINSFSGMGEGVLVSDNPEKQMTYQVGVAGIKVSFFGADEKPIEELIIGKNGPDFASSYVRRANDNKVYLVRRTLTGFFSPRVDDWLEKNQK